MAAQPGERDDVGEADRKVGDPGGGVGLRGRRRGGGAHPGGGELAPPAVQQQALERGTQFLGRGEGRGDEVGRGGLVQGEFADALQPDVAEPAGEAAHRLADGAGELEDHLLVDQLGAEQLLDLPERGDVPVGEGHLVVGGRGEAERLPDAARVVVGDARPGLDLFARVTQGAAEEHLLDVVLVRHEASLYVSLIDVTIVPE